jgi:Mrp family chromosome partitioning ATPase/predicted  nucleic acid-binding Zn-ribbon protein
VIIISYTSKSPEFAREIPNRVARAFMESQRADKLDSTKQASTQLKTEIDKLESNLKDAETRIAEFRAESGLLIGQNNSVLSTQQLSEATSELSRVRASRATARARAAAVAAAIRNGTSLDTIPEVLSSELIRRLREREVELRTEIADLSVTLLDGHPRIKALRSQLADLQEQIRREAAKVQKGLEQEAATAQLREEELAREVNQLKSASGLAGGKEVRLNELLREAEVLRRTLEATQSNFRQALAREEQQYAPVDAKVIEAIMPAEPYAPNRPAIIGAAFTGSLLLSMIGVMLSELFSGRAMRAHGAVAPAMVRDVPMRDEPARPVAARAERMAASEPSVRAQAAGAAAESLRELEDIIGKAETDTGQTMETDPMMMVPPLKPTSRRAKQEATPPPQSTIRTLAERIVAGGLQRVVAVSPEGNEATAASIMLARFIADTGLRTLMIDLTANGALSSVTLDGAKVKGVTDILCGQAQFGDIIHPDLYSDAHVVPIGKANAARAIRAIERLPMIVNALNTAYEMVVIECGPTDAATVDRLVGDETLLVMNTINPDSETVAASASEFLDYGFEDVVMVTLQPGEGPGPRAGRSRAA